MVLPPHEPSRHQDCTTQDRSHSSTTGKTGSPSSDEGLPCPKYLHSHPANHFQPGFDYDFSAWLRKLIAYQIISNPVEIILRVVIHPDLRKSHIIQANYIHVRSKFIWQRLPEHVGNSWARNNLKSTPAHPRLQKSVCHSLLNGLNGASVSEIFTSSLLL